jgi:hypothetical protein
MPPTENNQKAGMFMTCVQLNDQVSMLEELLSLLFVLGVNKLECQSLERRVVLFASKGES